MRERVEGLLDDSPVEVLVWLSPVTPSILSWRKWPPGKPTANTSQLSTAWSLTFPPTSTFLVRIGTDRQELAEAQLRANCCLRARTNSCWRAIRW